ncbi:MAG: transcriptional regulator NrdR [Planctomycetes bacterium]|nr:transcriptional regulator NrdR [Planctomycetota bacterium]
MRCPYCKADNGRVIDSRSSADGFSIRRRRECLDCGRRFTTYERMEETPLRVVKKDGSRVPFDRSQILKGLLKACEKRPVSLEDLEQITTRIERALTEMFDREVGSKYIGQLVMDELKGLDQVAYVRFASVYREFKDVEQFVEELRPFLEGTAHGTPGQPRS